MKNKYISILLLVIFGLSAVNILKASADSKINWNVSPRLCYATWDLGGDIDSSAPMFGASTSVFYEKNLVSGYHFWKGVLI